MTSNWGVLISGNGGNLQALMEEVRVSVVISSKANAYGILRARRMGIPVEIAPSKDFEKWIWEILLKYNVRNIFLAGYLKIISADLITKMKSRGIVLNIHPSLLPKYKGLQAFEKAFNNGDKLLGVTVHQVIPEVDSGEFISQRSFVPPLDRNLENSKLLLSVNEQNVLRSSVRKYARK